MNIMEMNRDRIFKTVRNWILVGPFLGIFSIIMATFVFDDPNAKDSILAWILAGAFISLPISIIISILGSIINFQIGYERYINFFIYLPLYSIMINLIIFLGLLLF